jgi:hypothetical protein
MSVLNSIQSARQRGATDDQILSEIFKQNSNPIFRENITKAMASSSATEVLKEIENQNQVAEKRKSPGLLQSIAQGITNPFLKIIETGRDITRQAGNIGLSVGAKIMGKDEKAMEYLDRAKKAVETPGDYGYLGEVQGISGLKDAVATGVEAGTTLGTLTTKVPATILSRALFYGASGAVGAGSKKVQEGGDLGEVAGATAKGGIFGASFPVVIGGINSLVMKPTMYLLKALGAGLSGQSSKALSATYKGASVAQQTQKEIAKSGTANVFRKNAQIIMGGISKIKNEAKILYGKAMEALGASDVDDVAIKQGANDFFTKNGISVQGNKINLEGTEIVSPEIRKKLADVIIKINQGKVKTGADLRNLVSTVDKYLFKTPGSDADRLAYNQLLLGLKNSLISSIKDPNGILAKANEAYSKDFQIAETMEDIFGKVQFKNSSELLAISKKLDGLFSMKGLSEDYIEQFFKRIGIDVTGFRASQAVAQTATRGVTQNAPGVSIGEATGIVTSSILRPDVIQNIAIKSGIAAEKLKPLLEKMAPAKFQALMELFRD